MSEQGQTSGLGALIVTARASELGSLRVLLDGIDPTLARAWVVLQDVADSDLSRLAEHASVARVLAAGLLPLSHARNLALHELFAAVTAGDPVPDFVGFPDADGCYAPGALAAVHESIASGADIVIGRYGPTDSTLDEVRFPDVPAVVDWGLVRSRATSVTLFVSGRAALDLGYVMPYLGLGTPWPAGEDVELGLRALKRGYQGRYVPAALTLHPYGTELDPARRPIRYLLVAVYPPPGGSTVGRSLRRLTSGGATQATQQTDATSSEPTSGQPDQPAPGFGLKDEISAALKGANPALVRRLRRFANAAPSEQWALVERDGPTGLPN